VCELLAERGREVVCIDRLSGSYADSTGPASAARLAAMPEIRVVRADLMDTDLDGVLGGAGSIVHLAALPGVRSGRPLGEYWQDNALLTARLAAHAARRELRFLFVSSSSIYGDAVRLPTPEHAPPSPLSPYALSKLAAERACAARAREGADAVVARLFTVFGPGQRPDMALARWIRAAAAGEPILWQVPPGGARELTYVDDAARGLISALERGRPGEAYNVPGSGSHPLERVLELIELEVGRPTGVLRRPATALDPVRTEASRVKSTLELGYRPLTTLADGIRAQVEASVGTQAPVFAAASEPRRPDTVRAQWRARRSSPPPTCTAATARGRQPSTRSPG
jgi:UDP-glucuronate 4-epimerase